MRKKTLIILITILCSNGLFANNCLTEIDKLVTTAKVWGFLKYYHPNVASGKFNWDEQLFNVLPKIKKAKTKEELSQVYLEWLNNLGEVMICKKCDKTSSHQCFDNNFDLNWINSKKLFTKEISVKLNHVKQNRHQGKKYYVSTDGNTGHFIVTNEIDYQGFDWQDENLRMLTLFRYWNIIEYFFPYKYQTDTDWDEVLYIMTPKFLYPDTEIDFHMAMLELIASIDDSHARFVTPSTNKFFGYYWIPAKFKLIDDKAIVTEFYNDSLARLNDLKIGDVITKVSDKEIEYVFKEREKYIHGSNVVRKKANAYHAIFNGSSDSVSIELVRNDEVLKKTIRRYLGSELKYKSKETGKLCEIFEGNIGYIKLGLLKNKDVPEVMTKLKNTEGLVIDIRNYPNKTAYNLVKYFTTHSNDFYKVIYPDLDCPGRFIWKKGKRCGRNGELRYKGQVVLLVSEHTQSHAEYTTMCLQTGDNVTTIGSQTSGSDGTVCRFSMVGGYRTMVTGIGIFYPDNTETQRKGVKIDIKVKPTVEGVIGGKDELLDRAIAFLKE